MKPSLIRLTTVAVLALFISACSSTTFFYNRLDFLIPWYLDRYVDLDREQDRFLDRQLAPFLAWHREEELPRYLTLLEETEQALDEPVTAQMIEDLSLSVEAAYERVEVRGLEWMISLGEQLSDEQLAEFIDELRERQLKYEKKYLERSDAKYYEDAYENLRDNLQDYMGRLSSEQKADIEARVAALQRSDAIWLEERALWIDRLERILKRQSGWQDEVRRAIDAREDSVSPEYQAIYDNNFRVISSATAAVLESRTEKQDARLRREIADLRSDLELLIQQGQAQRDALKGQSG